MNEDFNKMIDNINNEDVYLEFLKRFPATNALTKDELKDICGLCHTGSVSGFADYLVLGPNKGTYSSSIFKNEELGWITWDTDERQQIFNIKQFDNSRYACYDTIMKETNNDNNEIEVFESFTKTVSDGFLKSFAKYFGFRTKKEKSLTLKNNTIK